LECGGLPPLFFAPIHRRGTMGDHEWSQSKAVLKHRTPNLPFFHFAIPTING